MPEIDRLTRSCDWIDLSFVERERTPPAIIEEGIRLHLSGLSLSTTKQELERRGIERSRTAIHDWVNKTDIEPVSDATPSQIALDEKVIQVNDQRHWFVAAVDPATNDLLHVRLVQTLTTQLTIGFLHELGEKHDVDQAEFLIDGAHHLTGALDRLGLSFRVLRHGTRNKIERVFREVERRTSSFSNMFSHAAVATAELWLQAYAVWQNRCQT